MGFLTKKNFKEIMVRHLTFFRYFYTLCGEMKPYRSGFFFLKKKLSEISDKHDDVQQESIHAELFSHKFNLKYKTRKK